MRARTERLRGRAAVAQRTRRLRRTHGLCEDCATEGRTEIANVVDHIVPLAHGGPDTDENTRNLCHYHHSLRTGEQFGFKAKRRISESGWPE
jgi:5-methylcytosine-specific restriction protein A